MIKAHDHPDLAAVPPALRAQAKESRAAAGDTLFRIGSRPRAMLFVLEGEIRLVRRALNGSEIVLQRSTAGFVAEASLESTRYHCDLVTALDSRLLQFPIAAFRDALRDDAGFRDAWMARLTREVRKLRAQCERLSLRSAVERIEHYIESEGMDGRIVLRQTRKAWAAELGITHEALYRALAALVQADRISVEDSDGALVVTMRR
jgi:CRP-like cAMP-binding protein